MQGRERVINCDPFEEQACYTGQSRYAWTKLTHWAVTNVPTKTRQMPK